MAKKIFNQKIINVSSKKLEEIGQAVVANNSLASLSVFFILISFVLVFIARTYLPEKIPLFYTRPWGEEQLAPAHFLFIIPGLSLGVAAFNSFVSKLLGDRDNTLTTILVFFSFLFSLIASIAVIKIIILMV